MMRAHGAFGDQQRLVDAIGETDFGHAQERLVAPGGVGIDVVVAAAIVGGQGIAEAELVRREQIDLQISRAPTFPFLCKRPLYKKTSGARHAPRSS